MVSAIFAQNYLSSTILCRVNQLGWWQCFPENHLCCDTNGSIATGRELMEALLLKWPIVVLYSLKPMFYFENSV